MNFQNKPTTIHLIWLLLILSMGCKPDIKPFALLTSEKTGISFTNTLRTAPELNILNYIYYYNGGGVATADFNNDGRLDIIFTANQAHPELYLNLGKMQFSSVALNLNTDFSTGWTNGVSIVDINNDGWMDIYLCRVGAHPRLTGQNMLLVHQGLDASGDPIFEEKAKDYGLDFKGYGTQAAFFDYDLDGDLDVYLLNHSINPNQNYGKGTKRETADHVSGDKLYENIQEIFVDVTQAMGIFQGSIGYGLGLSISDYNHDGYPDLYIGNDFFENDYLYINQQGNSFKEVIHQKNESISHTTHYSMGNDSGDINNDGHTDIISVDMLPEDLSTYKTSGTEFNYQIYDQFIKNGYGYQFMQNTLQLNTGHGAFSEIGFAAGVAATEWSWSPLLADFDQDGYQDLYVTNGIVGATNDMDFINFVANEEIQKQLGANMTGQSMSFIDQIPTKHSANYIFQNHQGQSFVDRVGQWIPETPSYSNGAAYGDFDNDGDLDLVVNNVNEPAFILENHIDQSPSGAHFLKIRFQGSTNNINGIGTRVTAYNKDAQYTRENYTSRGYLSAVAPELHFGLDTINSLDSLVIQWPGNRVQTLYNVAANQSITLSYDASQPQLSVAPKPSYLLGVQKDLTTYKHKEQGSLDFNRNPLLPYALTHEGPDLCVADLNQDQLADIIFTGGKGQASQIWLQQSDGQFTSSWAELMAEHALNEDTALAALDANLDGLMDLVIASGGNEFTQGDPLKPRLYLNNGNGLQSAFWAFGDLELSASKVTAIDLNQDGAEDLIFTAKYHAQDFGRDPQHYIFFNDAKGNFSDVSHTFGKGFIHSGAISDLIAIDINNDDQIDLVTCGPWNTINIWLQKDQSLVRATDTGLEMDSGLWNALAVADFDLDGDLDLMAGNWGINSRWTADQNTPLRLYKYDFDQNKTEETLVTYVYQGKETPMASKEELAKQMPKINKQFLSFKDFANATVDVIFGAKNLEKGLVKEVTELRSCYFENTGGLVYKKQILPQEMQYSSINDLFVTDLNGDGLLDVLPSGNTYEISTQLGRLDAFKGGVLLNRGGQFIFDYALDQPLLGAGRKIAVMPQPQDSTWIMTRNNNTPIYLKKLIPQP